MCRLRLLYVYLQALIFVRLLAVRARVVCNVLSEFDSWQYERVRWYSASSEVLVVSLAGTHGLCGSTVVELPCKWNDLVA